MGALTVHGQDARAEVLVLDACVKQCDEVDLRVIGSIRALLQGEMKRPGLVASVGDVLDHLGGDVPFPAEDSQLTSAKLTNDLKEGIAKWTDGGNQAAAALLQSALAKAAANPAVVVSDPTLRQLIPRAYVGWAVSLLRLDRVDEAKQAISDLVRTTPEPSILDSWGTEADRVFQLSRKDLTARGVGSLTIEVDDPTAVFYLNATGQPHKGVFAADLLPGVYRVFVLDAMGRSRRYWVEVVPRAHAMLHIDWHHDRDLVFEAASAQKSGRWFMSLPSVVEQRSRIGFTFRSQEERRLEGDYARRLARQAHSNLIVVVGRIKWEGKDAMSGVVYQADHPSALRVGVVQGVGSGLARDLVRFLFSQGAPSPNVIALAAPPWEPSRAPTHRRLRWPARALIIGGSVALAVGAGLYAIDEDPEPGVSTFNNTAPSGVAWGIVGIASLGAGIWWSYRNAQSPVSAPIVSVGSSHAMLGWARSY